MPARSVDLAGQVIGHWTVLSQAISPNPKFRYWHCRCECGNEKDVAQPSLTQGKSLSCGCGVLPRKPYRRKPKHGSSRTPEYKVYMSILGRCSPNPSKCYAHCWADYGGRGITICERWQGPEGFQNFLADMGERPSAHHSIDRIDNDGPYSPENCRWATYIEQNNNRRGTRMVTIKGVAKLLAVWAHESNIHPDTVRDRLKRGWSPERAVCQPIGNYRTRKTQDPGLT